MMMASTSTSEPATQNAGQRMLGDFAMIPTIKATITIGTPSIPKDAAVNKKASAAEATHRRMRMEFSRKFDEI